MSETHSVKHDPALNRFEIDLDGQRALLEYQRDGNSIVFTHTEVPPAFEGRGYGSKLVEAGLAWAHSESADIVPACPFVAAYMRRHPHQPGAAGETDFPAISCVWRR